MSQHTTAKSDIVPIPDSDSLSDYYPDSCLDSTSIDARVKDVDGCSALFDIITMADETLIDEPDINNEDSGHGPPLLISPPTAIEQVKENHIDVSSLTSYTQAIVALRWKRDEDDQLIVTDWAIDMVLIGHALIIKTREALLARSVLASQGTGDVEDEIPAPKTMERTVNEARRDLRRYVGSRRRTENFTINTAEPDVTIGAVVNDDHKQHTG